MDYTEISKILAELLPQIWTTTIIVALTLFFMTLVKNFVTNLINYIRVKSSSIGYKSRVFLHNQLWIVEDIKWNTIKLINPKYIMFIALKDWVDMEKTVPQPDENDFNNYEDNYDIRNGFPPKAIRKK